MCKFRVGRGPALTMGGDCFKDTKIPCLSLGHRILFFCKVGQVLPCGKFDALVGPGAAIDIMGGIVTPVGLEEFIDGGWEGLAFFSNFLHIDRLIAELPEMMFGVMLIPVGEELKL